MRDRVPHRRRPIVPALVAVVAALAAVAMVVVPQLSDEPTAERGKATAPPAENPTRPTLARRAKDDPMALGRADAPVVLVEYSDFQCPFCGRFARQTEPALIRKYVDRGVLRIEWRDFPYLGPESMTAAKAGRAAAEQGRFWEFHEAMYADQPPPNSGRLTVKHVVSVARRAGLDVVRFRRALNRPSVAQAVERDFREGQQIGVTGTPAFLLNGEPIMGAQPTDVFVRAIEDAAAKAR